jgi:hypothetical protein
MFYEIIVCLHCTLHDALGIGGFVFWKNLRYTKNSRVFHQQIVPFVYSFLSIVYLFI